MEERLQTLLTDLVSQNSVSPTLADGPGEQVIAQQIFSKCRSWVCLLNYNSWMKAVLM